MIHRAYFYDNVRHYLFGETLTQSQVDGLAVFLDWHDTRNPPAPEKYHTDDRQLAYVLATVFHETAQTMRPITEYGGESYLQGKAYYPWYGRGYVQLTWQENYAEQDAKLELGGALLKNPDLALDPNVALRVCLGGMHDGDFTGTRLGDFFTAELTDWYEARTIINGHDRADDIAIYAERFHNAIGHT